MFIISAFRLQLTFILLQGTSSQFCLRLNAIICESSPSSPSSILPQLPRSVNRRTRFSDRKLSVLNPRLPHALLGSLNGEVLTFPLSVWLTIARSILLRDTLKTYPATFTTRPRSTETSTTLHSPALSIPFSAVLFVHYHTLASIPGAKFPYEDCRSTVFSSHPCTAFCLIMALVLVHPLLLYLLCGPNHYRRLQSKCHTS